MNQRLRKLCFALSTALGRPRGIFIPYKYAHLLHIPQQEYPYLKQWLKVHEQNFLLLLKQASLYTPILKTFGTSPPPAPRWQQDWFTGLDALIAYTLVRQLKPSQIIEIGCGHSTRFLCKAILDENIPTRITAIDPTPRISMKGLPVSVLPNTLQNISPSLFHTLTKNDILFIDSSHIAVPGSDVDLIFSNIIPSLPRGIHIHFHDIFLPHDYPLSWKHRHYNEQQTLSAALTTGGFKPLFASHYTRHWCSDALTNTVLDQITLPTTVIESSLWLQKIVPPLLAQI